MGKPLGGSLAAKGAAKARQEGHEALAAKKAGHATHGGQRRDDPGPNRAARRARPEPRSWSPPPGRPTADSSRTPPRSKGSRSNPRRTTRAAASFGSSNHNAAPVHLATAGSQEPAAVFRCVPRPLGPRPHSPWRTFFSRSFSIRSTGLLALPASQSSNFATPSTRVSLRVP